MLRLIETPTGQRPLRTIVDAHPQAVEAIDAACEQAQAGLLGAMQLDLMIQTSRRSRAS